MRTLTFTPGGCQLVEAPAPAPQAGQVLVRLRGTLVDETHLSDYRLGQVQAPYLVSAEVLQPGAGVIDFRRGQSVLTICSQALSQYLLLDEEELIPISNGRPASCMLMGIALAMRAFKDAEVYPESTVIGGAGFVGLTLAAILKTTTPWVFGTNYTALLCAQDLGATHFQEWEQARIDLKAQGLEERGYGAVLIDTTGRHENLMWSQHLTLKGGTVVCAVPMGPTPVEPSGTLEIDATRFHYDQITWKALGPPTSVDIDVAATKLDLIPDSMVSGILGFDEMEKAFTELDLERGICYLMTDEGDI